MRHLPNLLTLANLFCGCLAIVCILNAEPYLINFDPHDPPGYQWVHGTQQIWWSGALIFIGALFDAFDGFAARALRIHSPIGKDLDSLADVVTFGVAPSMIMYKLLWESNISNQQYAITPLMLVPAFAIAIFAALRLARFNVSPPQSNGGFTGLPTPAVGLLIASFALTSWPDSNGSKVVSKLFYNMNHPWCWYLIIALLCWLMVSKVRFIKLLPGKFTPQTLWPLLVVVLGGAAAFVLVSYMAIPIAFVLYAIVSQIAPKAKPEPTLS